MLLLYISLLSLHNNDIKLPYFTFCGQCAKKVVSHSPGLVDFAIGLVTSVFKLPDGQLKFFGGNQITKNCNQTYSSCYS